MYKFISIQEGRVDFSLSLDEKVWKITEMYYDNQVFAKIEDAASEERPKVASSKYGLKVRCKNHKLFFPGPLLNILL